MTTSALWLGSPNYAPANRRVGEVRALVLHDTEGGLIGSLTTLRKAGGASAHYVVDIDGALYQLVKEQDVAYHVAAFGSNPALNRNRPTWLPAYNGRYSVVNAATIGIELVGFASQGFTPAQYATLGALCADLCQRWRLSAALEPEAGPNATILTHGWLQTDRTDPGPHFDWPAFRRALEEHTMSDAERGLLDYLRTQQIDPADTLAAATTLHDLGANSQSIPAWVEQIGALTQQVDETQHQAAAVRELMATLTAEVQAAHAARRIEAVTLHYADGTSQDVAAG